MSTAAHWIQHLALAPHPEGGFYRESYRSPLTLSQQSLPKGFNGSRSSSTAIYFLLGSDHRSLFHKIKSDELWHFHCGTTLIIVTLSSSQGLQVHRLGLDTFNGDLPQAVIPANTWFGAYVEAPFSFALSSCTVAPGFDFKDFEMAQRNQLLSEFPNYKEVILKLTT